MKIYILGDSISVQYGPYLQAYLDGIMECARKQGDEEALLNLDNPQGANGGDSSMVLSFLKAKVRSDNMDADILLLNCGLHDIKTNPASGLRQVPIERYRKNLEEVVHLIKTTQCRLVWIRTTPLDDTIHNGTVMSFHRFSSDCDKYNRVADEIMNTSGVPIIDLHTFTRNLGGDLYCDHVHFHESIREKQAAFLAGWLMAYTNVNTCLK